MRQISEPKRHFVNEWLLAPLAEHPTFFTKRMFGGLAAYLFERQMLVLVEPTRSGRWQWHGVLLCTDYGQHSSIQAQYPALRPHEVLRKWLYIESSADEFEATMESLVHCLAANDPRFGIVPRMRDAKAKKRTRET